ncbi:uncharacterized protein [Prorops nasuta]|uniref:uncharacterized protein n=1 Tax=Prorops nasuta TaxID=863751 RepID=UPI0034CD6A37
MRKQNIHHCSGGNKRKLFLLEIFVDFVSFYAGKIANPEKLNLAVDFKFIDFPLCRIKQSEFESTKQDKILEITKDTKRVTINFECGKFYIFPKSPSELVAAMRLQPLLLDIYSIEKVIICPSKIIKDSLGEVQIPFPDCLCDQIIMADNDTRGLPMPKPFTIKNTFPFADKDSIPNGIIRLKFKLSCFGHFLNAQHAILHKTLLLKSFGSYNEFQCSKIPAPDDDAKREIDKETRVCLPHLNFETSEPDCPPAAENVAGLILICEERFQEARSPVADNLLNQANNPADEPFVNHPMERLNQDNKENKCSSCICRPDGTYLKLITKSMPCNDVKCGGGLCSKAEYRNKLPRDHHGGVLGSPCYTGSCCIGHEHK